MAHYILSLRCDRAWMKNNNDVPALIKKLRQRLDLTQEQFAHRVGVTYSTVNHWENGKRVPLPFLVNRLLEMKEELDGQKRGGRAMRNPSR